MNFFLLKGLKYFLILKTIFVAKIIGVDYVVRQLFVCPDFVIAYLLRRFGAAIGENVNFKGGLQLDNVTGDKEAKGDFSNLIIGEGSYIGKHVFFDLPARVVLGKECVVSAGVKFLTHQDCGDRMMATYYARKVNGITVGEGSWIGANAIILAGVKLGKLCVVGAGAVVTESFPDNSVIGGVPAQLIKTLHPNEL